MAFDWLTTPFLCGLLLAVILPWLGCYLRLRDEWLAALAYAHVAAAGALLASLAGVPPTAGGLAAAAMAGWGKHRVVKRLSGHAAPALMWLAAWATSVLLVANLPMAERLGHALFDGQLFFADGRMLGMAALALAIATFSLRRGSRPLLLAHVYPDFSRLRGEPAWALQAGFDVLAALLLALATLSLGVMGAFALIYIPPWLAFRRGRNWSQGIRLAILIGGAAYVLAFALALAFDQPFGPVLVLVLLLFGVALA
ncbi:MAG: metal ABC transporter permease [Azonexus sp.]|nr:metal ABC transporter permease [Azonexus sp.]